MRTTTALAALTLAANSAANLLKSFGWQRGPFEIWQAAGWQQVAKWIEEDIAAGKTMSKAPLPAWASDAAPGRGHRASA